MLINRGRAPVPSGSIIANDVLRLRVGAGLPPDDTGDLSARCARAVAVAMTVGAPLGDAVDGATAAEDDAARARRAVEVASAQTRTVAIGLLAAPLLLVPGLGRLLGADLVGFYGSGIGLVVLAAGLSLLGIGAAAIGLLIRRIGRSTRPVAGSTRLGWSIAVLCGAVAWRAVGPALAPVAALAGHHLVSRRVSRRSPAAGFDEAADLAATALAGGVSVPEALRVAAAELPAPAADLHRLAFELELGLIADDTAAEAQSLSGADRIRAVLVAAEELGAPAAPALHRLAAELRADDLARVLAAAERLPAQLTFPTALCLLPATVLLVGAPIVHAGLSAAGA